MKRLFIIILCLFYVQNLVAQSYVTNPDHEINYLQPQDIKINEKKGAYYNEQWAYHVVLDNGAQIYVTYAISYFAGLRGSVSSGRLSLINWEGKDYRVAREYNLNDLVFVEDAYKMDLNPERGIWFEGKPGNNNHRFYYRTQKDGIHYDISINFDDPFPGFTQGNGEFQLGEQDQLGMFTHIPYSKVSGFIALDRDTAEVTGIGFMDHTYASNITAKLFKSSYKFNDKTERGFSGGYFMIPKDRTDEAAGYAYFYDGEQLTLKNAKSIEVLNREEVMGKKIPIDISINYEDGTKDTLHFDKIDEKVSMLDELAGLKKIIAKRFLGGEVLFYRGKARKNNSNKTVFFNLSLVN